LEKSWNERGTYGIILKDLIAKQLLNFQREKDPLKKTRIAQNIGYLCQVQASLITSEDKIEERIAVLEKVAGIAKKGIIPR